MPNDGLFWEAPEALIAAGRQLVALWEEGVQNSLCLFTTLRWSFLLRLGWCFNCLLRAMKHALQAVCSSQSDSFEHLLLTLLAFSNLALAHLGGSGVEVLLMVVKSCCC